MRGGPSAAQLRAAAEAEADYQRMAKLRQMSAAELRTLLGGEPAKAAAWIESAARFGLAEAQLRLGQMLLDGVGVARDEIAALAWFVRAARQGDGEAMNMVGRCHENGWGTAVDLEAAADWYARSGAAGCAWGCYNHANMLFDGRGVVQDLAGALAGYRRAAKQGHARAMNLLARCCEEGWGAPRDGKQARAWYRRSAEAGYFRAQFNHASVLAAEGHLDAALGWFETALREAPPDARASLAAALRGHEEPRVAALGQAADAAA